MDGRIAPATRQRAERPAEIERTVERIGLDGHARMLTRFR
jgi:hypothetical protein